MALAPVTLYDSFSRTIASGWGTSDTGQAWSTFGTVKTHGVANGEGYIDVPSGQGIGYKWQNYDTANPPIRKEGDTEVLVRMQWRGDSPWPLTDTGPIINRHPTDSTFYYASLQGYYAEASIGVSIKGYRYELDRKAITLKKEVWYWVRFRRETDNKRIKLKIWADTVAEPTSWLIDTLLWTGNNPPTTGSSGFFVRGTTMPYQVRVTDYYVYTLEDTHPSTTPADDFSRTVSQGWGRSSSGHFWEGNVSNDPAVREGGGRGNVVSGYGNLTVVDTDPRFGFLGPAQTGSTETYAEFTPSEGTSGSYYDFGVRGTMHIIGGEVRSSGYYVEAIVGSTTINLQRSTASDMGVFLTGHTLPFTISANVRYSVKIQAVGTTIRAKLWPTSEAEPNFQFSAVDTTYSSGSAFFRLHHTDATGRSVRFHNFRVQAPSVDTAQPINKTTLGQLVQTASTDTSISVQMPYTHDTNGNLAITSHSVKLPTEVEYTPATISASNIDRTAKMVTLTVTGLQVATEYDIRVGMGDPDGVEHADGTLNIVRASTTALGVRPQTASITSISGTEATIKATYSLDTNSNSGALLYRRVTSRNEPVIDDSFAEIDGIYLQNHRISGTERWTKHPLTTAERNAYLRNQQLRSGALSASDQLLYYVTASAPTNEYDVTADFFIPRIEGTVAILGRLNTSLLTAYGARYNGAQSQWELVRYNNGVVTVLGSYAYELNTPTIHNVKLVLRDAYKAIELDGTEIIRSTDNTIASGQAGYYSTGIADGNEERYVLLDNFEQAYRVPSGSWTYVGQMTADRPTKSFTRTATGLALDTVYEFRVEFTDVDGVVGGSNFLYTTGMTIGQAVQLQAIGAAEQATSAVIDIMYDYDTNDNSTVNILYRSTRNLLWSTVNQSRITVERGDVKRFTTTLVGLKAATTYELRVIISDPDGLIEGSPREASGLFTTSGVIEQVQKRTKHYLWKVYTPDNKYIGTLENVGDPEYSWQSNGGVTDLSARILAPIADSVNGRNPLVAHQNRVDVWVLDPASDGLGPNLIQNGDCTDTVGGWTLGAYWNYDATGGPDGSSALKYSRTTAGESETESVPIMMGTTRPLCIKAVSRALGGKVAMYVMAFNRSEQQIDVSDEEAETVGSDWQELKINYKPPRDTYYIRVIFRNRGTGTMWVDKVEVHAKEALVYRGMIESYTPTVDQNSQYTEIQILGLVSLLSDDYIDHLQYVRTQPQKDTLAQRPNRGPADPANMMRDLVDIARQQNPRCSLYYTDDSIKPTGTIAEYTFRDQQLRAAFDKVRGLCPPDWHYFIDPDGCVNLRGPEHVTTHVLKANVHIMNFSIERSIRNLKNYVRIKGRQDEDNNEPDGYGSINYVAFDQASIDRYGKRVLFIRDAQITTPDTAEMFGDGRLEEYNREEQRAQCVIPDEKSINSDDAMLIGYNIESFRPGDMVKILDPISGARNTYWDKFIWNFDQWNSAANFVPLPTTVPIKEVQIHGAEARIELSERQPSGVSDYGRLARWLSLQNNDNE